MLFRASAALLVAALQALSQNTCLEPNFLTPRTLNLKPSATTHLDVLRQPDGSYTGYELTDAAPYRLISVSKNLERQLAACLPHTLPAKPVLTAWNPLGATGQPQAAAALPSGGAILAQITSNPAILAIDTFDPQHNFLAETTFSNSTPAGAGNRGDVFVALALADLNHDGKPDLVAAFATNRINGTIEGGVWVFLGNGDGTFQPGTRIVLKTNVSLTPTLSVTVGDTNGDGIPDILIAGFADSQTLVSYVIALGNGDGTFGPPALRQSVNLPYNTSFAIADLNGDGIPDIVASSNPNSIGVSPTITVILGGPGGSTQTYPVQPIPANSGANTTPAGVAAADLNGDGFLDIATASGTILFGNGTGVFPNRADYAIANPASVMISDFDGDGLPDLILGNGNPTFLSGTTLNPTLTVLFGTGAGTFAGAPVSVVTLAPTAYAFATADFNRDGIPDAAIVAWVYPSTYVHIEKGNGDGTFLQIGPTVTLPVSGGPPQTAISADFNHDGIPDLAIVSPSGNTSEELIVLLGKGDGTFASPLAFTLPDSSISFMAAPDVNGDGIPDLVAGADDATVYIFPGKGDGTFLPNPYQISNVLPAFAFGDFNSDGKLDIALVNSLSSNIAVYPGKGDGTFGPAVFTLLPAPALGAAMSVAAADFDSDGKLDLAVTLYSRGFTAVDEVLILSGNGAGGFTTNRPTLPFTTNLTTADINGDKIPDLVGDSATGFLSACPGNGDGTFQTCAAIGRAAQFYSVTDLNKDGTPDVAVLAGGGLASYLNLAQPSPPLTVVSAASFAAGPLAPGAIASAFGERLANATVTVSDASLATRPAFVYFTSTSQVNFVIPPATVAGPATVTVNGTLRAPIQLNPIAPALFAGAYVELAEPGQTYLVLFGTGFDAATAAVTTARVQGIAAPVTYAGVQPSFAGLDQINIALPASLLGTGTAAVSVTVGGVTSNTLYVTLR